MKKLLVIHHKKEKKKVKDIIFFSWIAFVIIVIPLDLIEKVKNVRYLLPKFVIQMKKLVDFKEKGDTVNLPNIFLHLVLIKDCCCGVVVITLVLHTKGPQFDPGQQHNEFYFQGLSFLALVHIHYQRKGAFCNSIDFAF